jgi:hypothetical protein
MDSGWYDVNVQSSDCFEISLIDGSDGSHQITGWDDEEEGTNGEEGKVG